MNSTALMHTDNGRRIDHYRLIDNRGWIRMQAYWQEGPRGTTEYLESIAVLNRTDTTACHSTGDGYDAKCSACWLGHGHSEAFHTACVEGWNRS